MCNVFSGLIVTKKGKDWGKVLFLSGVHHEKDREQVKDKYGDKVLAWESAKPYNLDEFKFTHTVNISEKEQKALMELLMKWSKKQNKENLLRSILTVTQDNKWSKKQNKENLLRSILTVTKDNKPTDDYNYANTLKKFSELEDEYYGVPFRIIALDEGNELNKQDWKEEEVKLFWQRLRREKHERRIKFINIPVLGVNGEDKGKVN